MKFKVYSVRYRVVLFAEYSANSRHNGIMLHGPHTVSYTRTHHRLEEVWIRDRSTGARMRGGRPYLET